MYNSRRFLPIGLFLKIQTSHLRFVLYFKKIELAETFEKFPGGSMFYSLRNRLFIIFTILLTVPFLVLSLLIPAWFTSVIEDQTKDSTVEMMEQYSIYINSVTSQAEDLGMAACRK
jgi:hypothetical protein